MKELTTTKPLAIGLIGLPGAGKSQFAREFGGMFSAPVLEADLLRREIFATAATNKEHDAGLKSAFWALAAELFKSKRTFLIDGNLNTYAGRSETRALAKKAGYDILWLWVQTSEAVAQDRSLKQKRGATNTVLTPNAFARAVASFESPRSTEEHIVLSGQRTFSSQVRPILKKIAESHESKLQPPRPADRPPRRSIFIR